jgi:hypothetical protein
MAEGRDERNERRSSSFIGKGHRRECASLWEGGAILAPFSVWPRKATKSVAVASLSKPLQRSCGSAVLVRLVKPDPRNPPQPAQNWVGLDLLIIHWVLDIFG